MPDPKREPTPGPWEVYGNLPDRSSGVAITAEARDGFVIAEAATCRKVRVDEQWANARLIAASPDLLEACQKALIIAESWAHDQLDGTRMLNSALKRLEPVRAAIAKAKGEPE